MYNNSILIILLDVSVIVYTCMALQYNTLKLQFCPQNLSHLDIYKQQIFLTCCNSLLITLSYLLFHYSFSLDQRQAKAAAYFRGIIFVRLKECLGFYSFFKCVKCILNIHFFYFLQELLKNERYREQIKIKAEEVDERDKALQSKEYEEGLVAQPAQTQIKGHASATLFGQSEVSEDPVSTANTFQPGSWAPPGAKK